MNSRDRRGQLLLVAGLGLAVAFVALALVLNAVVFTENLATRNHGRADDAVGFENAVERGVGGVLSEVNRLDNADYASLNGSLAAGVETWDGNASRLAAGGGAVTETSLADVNNGTRVFQFEERNFSDANGDADWTVATDVADARRFHVEANPTSDATPLTLTATDGTASWSVETVGNGSGGTDVAVRENGSVVWSEADLGANVTIDVTEGTVDGRPVSNWTFAENVTAPYRLEVANGGDATGRYQVVLDNQTALPATSYADADSGDAPTFTPAIYSADVDVTFRRATLTYETTVVLAPESAPAEETDAVAA
ncbi:DUF7261 family protein [Halobacterium wangiae]|uniref:DUF7261 family protein n=1 Tax=Halobacterium wangiae TaxID=2902623 RepID=UPI001E42084F|nr:hypothetical protein [Halobacterium wangiae]